MGIIQKQSIGFSIVSYLGVAVGAISTIFIYPKSEEIYGLFRYLTDTANLFVPFATMGGAYVAARIFPIFRDKNNGHNGMMGILLLMLGFGSLACLFFYWLGFEQLMDTSKMKDGAIFEKYMPAICPLFLLMGLFLILKAQCVNVFKVIYPTALEQSIKISFPIVFLSYLAGYLSLTVLVVLIVFHYLAVSVFTILYLIKNKEFSIHFDKKFITPEIKKDIIDFAIYGFLGSSGAMLALRIDTFMVGSLTGNLSETGSFSIGSLIASNILIPLTAIQSAATPVITKAWVENDMAEIKKVYQKSTNLLLMAALLLFGCVCLCLDDLFMLMPNQSDKSGAKMVVLLVGFKCVFDMATGVNDAIIGYSPRYRFSLYLLPFILTLNIIGNFMFIPAYGIVGAAMATLLSSVIYNISKFIFLLFAYKLNPYSIKSLLIIVFAAIFFTIVYFLPIHQHPIINIALKGGMYSLAFLSAAFFLGLLDDVVGKWRK